MVIKADPAERNGTADATVLARSTSVASDIGAQVRASAADSVAVVVKRAPAILAVSLGSIARAVSAVGRSSTDSLALGTVFTAGASGGMLMARAPRMLVALAMVPAVVFGGTLLGRWAAHADVQAPRSGT